MRVPLVFIALVGVALAQYPLNYSCPLPTSMGGTGVCGPAYCSLSTNNLPSCNFTQNAIPNWQQQLSSLTAKTCTQSTDCRCSSSALKATVLANSGLVAAWCNDQYLVLASTQVPTWTPNLGDIRNPPGGNVGGVSCVTRTTTLGGLMVRRIPLSPKLLTTSVGANNVAFFSAKNAQYTTNMITNANYGVPSTGSVGWTVGGQEIYPVYNNRGLYTPENCETDSCNEHVGQGGGQPHLHGDPFSSSGNCLYSQANYTNPSTGAQDITQHPPQIGWSWDVFSIYGRHLSTAAPGYSTALDNCGGHSHDNYPYHYHAQVFAGVTDTGCTPSGVCSAGQSYAVQPPGPFQCWKGDISQMSDFFSYSNNDASLQPCSGMQHFYVLPSYASYLNGKGTQAQTISSCTSYSNVYSSTTTTGATGDAQSMFARSLSGVVVMVAMILVM